MSLFPSKSKCRRTLAKVYPGAHFAVLPPNERGHEGLELRYTLAGGVVPVCSVHGPNASLLPFAVLRAAFRFLGFETVWLHAFPGRFDFKALESYVGPESMIPVELDPREPERDLTESKPETTVSQPDGAVTPNN
jgi:hypothetical protein